MRSAGRRICIGYLEEGSRTGRGQYRAWRGEAEATLLSCFLFQRPRAPSCLRELACNASIERRIVSASFLLETQCRPLERVQNVSEVQLGDARDRLVRHCGRCCVGMGVVGVSDRKPSTSAISTTIAVMLSSPPRPFASEINA